MNNTTNINPLACTCINTVNYIFLRKVFKLESYSECITEELSLYLNSFDDIKEIDSTIRDIILTELTEGSYLNCITTHNANKLLQEAFAEMSISFFSEAYKFYLNILKEAYLAKKNLSSS